MLNVLTRIVVIYFAHACTPLISQVHARKKNRYYSSHNGISFETRINAELTVFFTSPYVNSIICKQMCKNLATLLINAYY